MEYTLRMAEEIAKKLRDLPPIDASERRLNKQGVIQHLAAEIAVPPATRIYGSTDRR
jgi:hypothetical protein